MSREHSNQIVFGLVLVGVGAALLANNMDLIRVGGFGELWPLIVIGIGVTRLIDPTPGERRDGSGLWLVMIGTWLLLNTLDVLAWRRSWPLVIVAVGVGIVWRGLAGRHRAPVEEANGC